MKNNGWISTSERLPKEGEYVLVLVGKSDPQVACLRKGISKDERLKMANGELPDPLEFGWDSRGFTSTPRSRIWKACDEEGNNLVPYRWFANGGPMEWFGQDVTHWMPIPEPPKATVQALGQLTRDDKLEPTDYNVFEELGKATAQGFTEGIGTVDPKVKAKIDGGER